MTALSSTELLNTVIMNFSLNGDIGYLRILRETLKKTKYVNYIGILDIIEKYYINYGKFPSEAYIKKHLVEVEEDFYLAEYLPEYNIELLGNLRKEIVSEAIKSSLEEPQDFSTYNRIRDIIIQNAPQQEKFVDFDDEDLEASLRAEHKKRLFRATGVLLNISLDLKTRGCPFGATTVIGGIAGSGKTNVALATAFSAVFTQNLKGAYISLEIAKRVIWQRLVSRYLFEKGYEIDNSDIINATLTPKQEEIYFGCIKEFQKCFSKHLKVVTQEDLPDFNKAGLESFFSKLDSDFDGLDFIIIDQASLLKYFEPLNGKGSAKDEYAIINQYIRYFTTLSYSGFFRKPVAMIILCQIKREAFAKISKRKPLDLSVFAESSEVERSANQAIVIRYTDEQKLSGLIEFVLVKNRDGESSSEYMPAVFLPQYCKLGVTDLDDSPSAIQQVVNESVNGDSIEDLV